ncbi:two pore calcium channel protein 1a, partial [Quercus suber]
MWVLSPVVVTGFCGQRWLLGLVAGDGGGGFQYGMNLQWGWFWGISLFILVIHTFFPISYEGYYLYWKSLLNRLKVFKFVTQIADKFTKEIAATKTSTASTMMDQNKKTVELRATIFILAGILGTYLNVLFSCLLLTAFLELQALGLLFLLFSSWLAYVMFEDTQQGKIVFTSYGTTLYQMFVLFTTSNNPDVWIPAYKASRWFCLFFVLYVLLGVYFVTNLILAVVYDSFKDQ